MYKRQLIDGTPILDIKPYIPYSDCILSATTEEFKLPPEPMLVNWLCEKPDKSVLIEKVVALDPRPGHDREEGEEFGVSVAGWNVRFKEMDGQLMILKVNNQKSS